MPRTKLVTSGSNWFIACNKFNSPTARELAHKLGIGFGLKPKRSRKNIIRWGYSGQLDRLNNTNNFPTPEAIFNCSDKLRALQILQEKTVNVPKFWTSFNSARTHVKFPLYCRRRHHTMGKDIIMIHNESELANGFHDGRYVVESIKFDKEYRIHIFNSKMISASKKYFGEELWTELGKPDKKDIIRNNSNGWRYHYIKDFKNVPEDVVKQAKAAVIALGLLWGAVDIIRTPDKKSYVLEVNSAPGLRDAGVDIYVSEFKQLMTKQNS